MLTALAISNYRSFRNVVIPLQRLNVITGANGSGKSSLYRALRLLADTAQGRVVSSIAREGGLQSTLWAGPETISRSMRRGDQPIQATLRTQPVNLRLGFVVVTHARPVVSALAEQAGCHFIMLEKEFGETRIASGAGAPAWHWPAR